MFKNALFYDSLLCACFLVSDSDLFNKKYFLIDLGISEGNILKNNYITFITRIKF